MLIIVPVQPQACTVTRCTSTAAGVHGGPLYQYSRRRAQWPVVPVQPQACMVVRCTSTAADVHGGPLYHADVHSGPLYMKPSSGSVAARVTS